MRKKYLGKFVSVSLSITFALAAIARAQVVGVDFNLGGSSGQSPLPTDVAGPYPSAGWYNLVDLNNPPTAYYNPYNASDTGSPITLVDNTGGTTGIQFGFNTGGFSTYNGGSTYSPANGALGGANNGYFGDWQLFNGSASAAAGGYTQQITLSNIPYASYDVYILAVAAENGGPHDGYGSVQVFYGGLTQDTPAAGPTYWFSSDGNPGPFWSGSYIQADGTSQSTATIGANYALFSGLTDSTVTFDVSSPGISYNNGMFVGAVEIVAAVPEPGSCAAIGLLGLLGLSAIRRRWAS